MIAAEEAKTTNIVEQQPETTVNAALSAELANRLRYVLLAGLGAMALTWDEVESLIKRLVERGEMTRRDAEKLLNEQWSHIRQQSPQMDKVGTQVEHSVENVLNWLNIPSKHDIDDLSEKIVMLTARIDELRKN
jgi:poly(hydroxyalkanoate) granule-associated protein